MITLNHFSSDFSSMTTVRATIIHEGINNRILSQYCTVHNYSELYILYIFISINSVLHCFLSGVCKPTLRLRSALGLFLHFILPFIASLHFNAFIYLVCV